MDIFSFHKQVIDEYASYVRSFIDILDPRVREEVDRSLTGGELWPEPLIQFNPSVQGHGYNSRSLQRGGPSPRVESTCSPATISTNIRSRAMRLGTAGRDFIVTSGTGSGKSLAYFGTIFDHIFRHPAEKGTRAILVYPMNALINSQLQEIDGYAKRYLDATGQPFPITYARYTGQESQADKQQIIEKAPHILLTNYMMLELIMTRLQEDGYSSFDPGLASGLWSFDELHTYRGRQGSDVSLLNRRSLSSASIRW